MKKLLFGPRLWAILLVTLLVFGGLFAMQWYGSKMMNQAMDARPRNTVTISAAAAESVSWQSTVAAVGTLSPINGAALATEVSGIVERIVFDNGESVSAGDVIMELRTAPDRAELKALEAAAELARLESERARSLVDERNISRSELDRRATELDQALAQVSAQEARIEQKRLRAPFDGRLGIRRYNVGDYVVAGDTVIELQSLDRLYVDLTLPDRYSGRVEPGMQIELLVPALGDTAYSATINAVAPTVATETRNFALQGIVENADGALRSGMFARLTLPLGEPAEQIVVPGTAISYRPYGNSVFVVEDAEGRQTVSQRFVTLGDRRGDMIAVVEGLQAGETVATSGLLKLGSGVSVQIDNSIEPDASERPTPDNS